MELQRPVITRYYLEIGDCFPIRPLRIVQLSDLHNTLYGGDQGRLVRMVRGESPDLIAVTGDLFDNRRSHKGAMLLLRGIRGIAPIYYVTGNHEYDPGVLRRLRPWCARMGVHLLEDRYETISVRGERVVVAGVNDPARWLVDPRYSQTRAMEQRFGDLEGEEGLRILLSHRPERIRRQAVYGFHLVLAGHAHGGQVRVPGTSRGLYAPNQGILPRYTRGVYKVRNTRMVVSCGLSRFATLPRVLNPPELVVITVGGKQPTSKKV